MGRRSFTDDSADRNCPSALFAGVLNDYIISSVCSTLLFYSGFSIAVNKKREKYISGHLLPSFWLAFFVKKEKRTCRFLSPNSETLVNDGLIYFIFLQKALLLPSPIQILTCMLKRICVIFIIYVPVIDLFKYTINQVLHSFIWYQGCEDNAANLHHLIYLFFRKSDFIPCKL